MASKWNYGKWNKVSDLSSGGQAITYIVVEAGEADLPANRRVLKRLKNPKRKNRFEAELQAGLTLSHPNIVKVVDHDLNNDPPYIVSEYCSGGSLEGAIDIIKGMDLGARLSLFRSICDGVAHAHQNNPSIIHRDIKPDNIFLRNPGLIPAVGDFGLCFIEDGERVTLFDEQVGSRFYMPPELADGKAEDVTTRSDVYSLGKVLYWLASGGKIFDREQHEAPKYNLTAGRLNPEYFMLNALLRKAITLNPADRFKDAAMLSREISTLIMQVDAKGNHIDITIPQQCSFCRTGKYDIHVDMQNSLGGRLDNLLVKIERFGFPRYDDQRWIIMICDNCAHVAFFRPDLSANRDAWKKK